MKTKFSAFHFNTLGFCLLASGLVSPVFAQSTAFTYQGRLNDGANPASGGYDLTFSLWNAASGPAQIGGTLTNANTAVSNGLFTATLDFGNQFPGADRWLEISVRTNGAGAFVPLTPRQKITPTPYAIMANTASNLLGALPAAQLSGTVGTSQLANNAVTSAKILDGTIVGADLANDTVGSAQLADTISLGDSNIVGRLDVFYANTLSNQPAITLFGGASQISTYGSDGKEQIRLWGDSWGELFLYDSTANNNVAATLTANSAAGGFLELNRGATNREGLQLFGGTTAGGRAELFTAGNQKAVDLRAQFDAATPGAWMALYHTNQERITFAAQNGTSGKGGLIDIKNDDTLNTIRLIGDTGSGDSRLEMYAGGTNLSFQILADDSSSGSAMYLNDGTGAQRVEIDSDDGDDAAVIRLRNSAGAATIVLDADVSGRGRVTTEELQIASSTASLTNNATLNPTTRYARISGSGGAVTLNAATAIANGSATGSILILEGTSDANTVTIPDAANTVIGVNRTLGLNDTLTLIWNGADWVQLSFSNN